jgi:hypothetical protein
VSKKYAAPTKYDQAEYKSIWEQHLDTETKWYIQVSKDSQNPIWITIGEFFTKIYQSCLGDGLFIEEQMELFEQKEKE